MRTSLRHVIRSAVVLGVLLASSPAYAQLDPLLFLKNVQPNIILVVDTSNRMQRDADLTYYDPRKYTKTGAPYEGPIGLAAGDATSFYRRRYVGLAHTNPSESSGDKFSGTRIETVGDLESGYSTFYERTRLAIARRGLIQAITDNLSTARFGLIRTRHTGLALPAAGNEGPVSLTDLSQLIFTDSSPGKWKITRATVTNSNSATGVVPPVVLTDAANSNLTIRTTMGLDVDVASALVPGGSDAKDIVDSPVGKMLDDARIEAARLITADGATGCRNTMVVLVVGGAEGTISPQDLTAKAGTFLNVSGRRVPIYVVAIAPAAADVAALQAIATTSGGQYFEITKALIDGTTIGAPVPAVVRAVNTAVQHGFASFTDVNTAPSGALPSGPQTEFQVTSPIVGTVNLKGASHFNPVTGALEVLPDSETEIQHVVTHADLPQRSNVLVTSGFALPGFEGRIRALRVYRPVLDSTKPSGYRFTQDGSRLWTASTPAAASRNIYTVLPGSTTLVKFEAANAATFATYLGVSDSATLIDWVRAQPLGAVVGSTPAFLDPPSLDPPPDSDYPGFAEDNSERRTLIFVGANDGMLHALDGRTGVEVWAFIPFNLLPKIKALRSGQPVDAFRYFVDSSPKISDVKIGADWRTFLFFGQGPGGTFYNTLDVTLEGMASFVGAGAAIGGSGGTEVDALVSYFADASRINWAWSFPRNTVFDQTIAPYGDVSVTASAAEKSVGETWSDPAIGQLVNENGPYVMLVGSGFMKYSVQQQTNRGGAAAGRAFYVLDAATGAVHHSRDVGADSNGETDDSCRTANNCARLKNALQMDPVATGQANSRFINKVYIGDLDGKVWRFDITVNGASLGQLSVPVQLYNAGAAYPLFASMATFYVVADSKQYIFVGTGSDLLPSNGVNQSYSLLVLLDNGASAAKTAEILLEATEWPSTTGGDEKVTAFPAVAGDIVFFTTTTHSPTTVCTPFSANLYAFGFTGGAAYDTNGDGTLTTGSSGGGGKGKGGGGSGGGSTTGDSTKVFSVAGARASAPFIVDQHLVFSAGGNLDMFGDPDDFNNGVGQAGVRILSWRLVK